MNYQKIYSDLTTRAITRPTLDNTYYEKHHIIPRCLGGSDDKSNLVKLTPEEHFVAHQLLVKIHPGHKGLKYALYLMTISPKARRTNNKMFGWIKRDYDKNRVQSTGFAGRKHTEATKELMKQKRALQVVTDETKSKISQTKSGVKLSDEARKSMSEKRNQNQSWIEARKRPCNDETKEKIRLANTGKKYDLITCTKCGKEGAGPNMTRYHFDNCKR